MAPKTSIYAIRTTISQERSVADLVTTAVVGETDIWECPNCGEQFSSKDATLKHMKKEAKKDETHGQSDPKLVSKNQLLGRVKAILVPETLRGYVFIETLEFRDVELAISGVPHVRGRVGGKVSFEEIDRFLIPKPVAEGLEEGDVVEVISGPFKGERARVARVEVAKEELILELLDSPHAIPIRVHADFCKLVEKGERERVQEYEDMGEGEEEEDEFDDESFWARDDDFED